MALLWKETCNLRHPMHLRHPVSYRPIAMRWLRLVSSLKTQVSFAKEPYTRDYILQKRPIFLRSLLIIAIHNKGDGCNLRRLRHPVSYRPISFIHNIREVALRHTSVRHKIWPCVTHMTSWPVCDTHYSWPVWAFVLGTVAAITCIVYGYD